VNNINDEKSIYGQDVSHEAVQMKLGAKNLPATAT